MIKQLRNFWILWVTMIVLACFSDAGAQIRYKIVDLGAPKNDNFSMVMSVNDQGWTEVMAGNEAPGQIDFVFAQLLNGRVLIQNVDGFSLDLKTLGGPNSWDNWGEINELGQVVGFSETAVPDPNGEDICGFGTHLTCLPFLWQFNHMIALPTLGGNNGEASAINNRGQIVGMAENGTVDSTCPPDRRIIGSSCRFCGNTATPRPFLRWMAIQTGSHFGSTIVARPQATQEPAPQRFTPYRGKTALPPRFLTSEITARPGASANRAKLLDQSAVLMGKSKWRALAEWQTHSSPPRSAGRSWGHSLRQQQQVRSWEATGTPPSSGPMASSIRTA